MNRPPVENNHAPDGAKNHFREILRLAIPAMMAIANEPLLSIADTAMIGRLGVEPLAARATGAALIGGIYWIFTFLVFGTTTLVGYHHGAHNREGCAETYIHALFVAAIAGVVVAGVGILFAPNLYRVMGAHENVLRHGISYFRIRIAGAPFTFLFYASVGFFRGIQNTKIPMLIAFVISGVNLLLDYTLIYGNLGLPALELRGAAIAGWFAQLIGASLCLGIFFYSRDIAAYRPHQWRIKPALLRPLFRIGRDLAVRTGALRLSLVFATGTAGRMGSNVLAAHEIAFQLFLLCSDVIDGFAVAGQALVAKYLGLNQKNSAYQMGKTLVFCGGIAGSIFAGAFVIAHAPIVQLFTNSSEVIFALAGGIFLLLALFQPLNGIVFVLDGFLIGARDTRFLMWAMLAGTMGIFMPLSWLSLHFEWGLSGLWAGVSALMAWRLVTNVYRFLSQQWSLTALERQVQSPSSKNDGPGKFIAR